ncbi:MAG TPA: DUF2339 domain-containing protein [Actinomycetota bacterium]|nr:DUF2339 domain-containing protein [Actinomycetota bacterium]
MTTDLERLVERFERLEREVEELKRSPGYRTVDAFAEPGAFALPVPDATPPLPAAVGSAEPVVLGEPIPDALDLEENVVGTWFPRLGALALLLGAGFGFRYAVDRGWIGPGARVGSGVALGVLLLLLGEATKRRGWAGYAQAVTGGGVAVLYLSVWASFALYGMVPDPVAFGLLVGVTTLAAGLALRHDSVALAVLATLGGFLNPIVVGRGAIDATSVYAYTVALDLGVFALASARRWQLLDKVAFVGSWTLYGLAQASGGRATIFATTIFVLFGSLPYLRSVVRRRPSRPADVIQMATNAAVYYAVSFANLSPDQTGPFTLTLSCVFLGQGLAAFGIAERDRLLRLGALGVGVALFTLWVFLEADRTWLPALWAAEGLGLTLIGYRVHSAPTRLAGAGVVALSVVAMLYSFEDFFPQRLFGSEQAIVYVCVIAVLYAVAFVTSRIPAERPYAAVAGVAANVLTLIWLSLEARGAVESARVLTFSISAIWAGYAALLLAIGIAARLKSARLLAIGIFGVTLVKMVGSDLWEIGPVHRIVSFAGIGALLLACSLLFHRVKHVVLGEREVAGEA